jgi:hypothetical protein
VLADVSLSVWTGIVCFSSSVFLDTSAEDIGCDDSPQWALGLEALVMIPLGERSEREWTTAAPAPSKPCCCSTRMVERYRFVYNFMEEGNCKRIGDYEAEGG